MCRLIKAVCYFFGLIFILGGLFLLVASPLGILGIPAIIVGIILLAVGRKAGSGDAVVQGGGGDSGGGAGKKWWELTEDQKKGAWWSTFGPGSWGKK